VEVQQRIATNQYSTVLPTIFSVLLKTVLESCFDVKSLDEQSDKMRKHFEIRQSVPVVITS
jgi:hypothetical protein